MTEPKIIRVLDAQNEDDRKYARENLIGCWVGYGDCKPELVTHFATCLHRVGSETFGITIRVNNAYMCRYIAEFSNSKPSKLSTHVCVQNIPRCVDCAEPKFYCVVNMDQVPDDARGKEWEFSFSGRLWYRHKFKKLWSDGMDCRFLVEENDYEYSFMRPLPKKPVKRMSLAEAAKELDFLPLYIKKGDRVVGTSIEMQRELAKKLNCEVVIDD